MAGLAVDALDHIWVIQRPSSLTPEEAAASLKPPAAMCCVPAPPVIEFDADGNVVQAWGGPGAGYEWFQVEHGIYVDPAGNVWVGGNGDNDNHVLKFTRDGKFLLQIGKSGQRGGSNDKTTLGGPAAVEVDARPTRSTSPTATRTSASSCSMRRPAPTSATGARTAACRWMAR